MNLYKKWWFWIIVLVVLLLISIFLYNYYVKYHNKKVLEQHESINYCNVDSDCSAKVYVDSMCEYWSSCFNKNETPLDFIKPFYDFRIVNCYFQSHQPCKCVYNKCKSNLISIVE